MKQSSLADASTITGSSTSTGDAASRRLKKYSQGDDRKSRSLACAQKLLEIKREYGEFGSTIESTIRKVRAAGSRDESSDRAAVWAALEAAFRMDVRLTDAEIAEDCDIPRADVKKVLDYLALNDLVEMRERDVKKGPRMMVYALRTTKPGEQFSSVHRTAEATAQVAGQRAA